MFARIGRARFRPEESEEVIRVARESLDTLKRLPGFQRMTYLYDRASGWGFAISLWAREEDAASVTGLTDVVEELAPYWAEEPTTESLTFHIIEQFPTCDRRTTGLARERV